MDSDNYTAFGYPLYAFYDIDDNIMDPYLRALGKEFKSIQLIDVPPIPQRLTMLLDIFVSKINYSNLPNTTTVWVASYFIVKPGKFVNRKNIVVHQNLDFAIRTRLMFAGQYFKAESYSDIKNCDVVINDC